MQRSATKLSHVEQLDLIGSTPAPKEPSRPVSFDRIYTLTDTHDALVYACELARKVPKQIYPEMGCDKSVWSRIVNGEWDLDGRDVRRFNSVVGNSAYLMYLNHVDGWDITSMRRAMDAKVKRSAELERQNAEKDRIIAIATALVSGRVPT